MKKQILMTYALAASLSLFAAPANNKTRIWKSTQAESYASAGHGVDCAHFLDPFLTSELANVSGEVLLDAGCGTASWSIMAAQNGASVCSIDQSEQIINFAKAAVMQAGFETQISILKADVEHLPYEANAFDRALSINLGCILPTSMQSFSKKELHLSGLGAHFSELHRVLKDGGRLLISAPASFDIVFTDGSKSDEEVHAHIRHVLAKIGKSKDPIVITHHLSDLHEVNRATFARRQGKLTLVTDASMLKTGEPIWRKIPGGAVENYYHTEEEYLSELRQAGLVCEEIKRPCFFGKVKYDLYHQNHKEDESRLGSAYIDHNPFTIYYVVKRA